MLPPSPRLESEPPETERPETKRPETEPPAPAGARRAAALRVTRGGVEPRRELIAEEEPVALVFNGLSYAVMMATPADLEDFALGFALTEGILASPDELYDTEVERFARGAEVRLRIAAERFSALRNRQRTLAGRTGCGLCGVDTIAEALRPVAHVASRLAIPAEAVHAAMKAFPPLQVLNAEVGAIHAAAFARPDGSLVAVREDVGRHNALDKLIGHLARTGISGGDGFVVVSSRCSYEMVHKTAAAGIPLIASVSAPTVLAVEFAEEAGVGLCAFVRDGRFTVYACPDRVTT
ncbi:formate dehydrogenase accessory sulfurtransferase FdhD [Prosthecomicrobium hirschii]|uniref:formate dehydrogenase accessory sulfurtransferase FdhD n=1 Tax=Prosthecodimorpha hirschii TaxID=665126 RepID=UPI0009FA73E3|nr:formate dehydrogenase accessory sulfurtransferase FdhD [Prosthecomicrobium hirschii]